MGTSSGSTETNKTTCETKGEKHYLHRATKKVTSLNSSKQFEELTQVEGCRWEALSFSETWRSNKAEMWETQERHTFVGAGKFENK